MKPTTLTVAVLGVTLSACAGAAATSVRLPGEDARFPVLLGPVRCIGCQASAPSLEQDTVFEDSSFESEWWVLFLPVVDTGQDATLGQRTRRAAPNACQTRFVVAELELKDWSFLPIVPLVFGGVTGADVKVNRERARAGKCTFNRWAPEAWP